MAASLRAASGCARRAFSDTGFSANLARVDQGKGGEEYTDPAAIFRIAYATEALQRVLTTTIARLAGRGGDPVIGLQTNFGGGKTHTMLALHHLAGAVEAGYRPGSAARHGAAEGAVETDKANARDLKLNENSFGFEEDRRPLKTPAGSSRLVLCCPGKVCRPG